jgi:hypothetical protein
MAGSSGSPDAKERIGLKTVVDKLDQESKTFLS